ncbi:hypothetical protein [Bradyrhizobium sp.]|uniref:hypothetical protein n=1 Tax=Bradyrhizobium sp. TaxID=376 RepID=UPI0026265B0F|nr:hypothetical protein [Bradyrhizobium sp.]
MPGLEPGRLTSSTDALVISATSHAASGWASWDRGRGQCATPLACAGSIDADMDDASPYRVEESQTCRLAEGSFRESQKRVDRDRSEIRFLGLTLIDP